MKKYAFLLGREPDLSLRELESVFGEVERRGEFALISRDELSLSELDRLGGTIKVGELVASEVSRGDIVMTIADHLLPLATEGKKLRIGIDAFLPALSPIVFRVKDHLKKSGKSLRVVQHDIDGRMKNATTIHEKLITQGCEIMLFPGKKGYDIARTVWIQDIESYSERDIQRERSMAVGMMPPKLAQMMINIATKGDISAQIWDPFCGLGTTLIEAAHAGYTDLIASDISREMVEATKKNIANMQKKLPQTMNDQRGKINESVFLLDATKLDTYSLNRPTKIVTEGMLGKNFTGSSITHYAAMQERELLSKLYSGFFAAAFRQKNIDTICCSLPFWNIGRDMIFLPDASQLIGNWRVDPLCKHGLRYLRHMRPSQCVGREIILLKR